MSRSKNVWLYSVAIGIIGFSFTTAQLDAQDPHVAYVFPAGCRLDTTCKVVLGGQHIKDASEVHISGVGVKAEIVSWYRPMSRGMYNQLRMRLADIREELVEKGNKKPSKADVAFAAGVSDEELSEMEIYLARERDPKRQPNDQLAEELTLRLTVSADAKLGKRELRLVTESAMSNPLWIQIGKWPEVSETEPNDTIPNAIIDQMPIVINGQIFPGDTDSFSFNARQGQKLVIEVGARDVIPFLADAVPGWFQATLALTDSSGKEVSYSDSFYYRQDPVVYFEVPSDGRYTFHIRDSVYRGREDFVYRITLGELPFVTSVFPLGARYGTKVNVELQGWNLTDTTFETQLMSRRKFRPVEWCSLEQGDGESVRFPLHVDLLTDVFDEEPNNTIDTSQEVTTRVNVHGRIDTPGDQDVYFIKGQGKLVAEILARRQGSPLDSQLTLTNIDGKEIAFNDDHEDKGQGLQTHHSDSVLEAFIPSSGAYLHVSDTQHNGGKDFVYRLSLRASEPDYEIRVTPGTIVARAGAITPITVFALRRDNYQEDIELALLDAPPGFELSGGIIPGNADRVSLTLKVPSTAPEEPVLLDMITRGRRGRGNRAWLTHPAIPAENMVQAFITYHLVPVEDWTVIVSGKPRTQVPFEVVNKSTRLNLPLKKEFLLNVKPLVKNIAADELRVDVKEPKGVTAEIITGRMGQFAIKLTVNPEEATPGLSGNLLLRAFQETTPAPTEENPNPKPRRTDYGFLPAIPFKIAEHSR